VSQKHYNINNSNDNIIRVFLLSFLPVWFSANQSPSVLQCLMDSWLAGRPAFYMHSVIQIVLWVTMLCRHTSVHAHRGPTLDSSNSPPPSRVKSAHVPHNMFDCLLSE
jgi:hypothetical protein